MDSIATIIKVNKLVKFHKANALITKFTEMTFKQTNNFAKNYIQTQHLQFNVIMERVVLFVKILYVIVINFVNKTNVKMSKFPLTSVKILRNNFIASNILICRM